jgi:hypothetical protein
MITPITTKFINTIPLLNDACKAEKIKPIPYIQCNNVSPKINVLQQDVFEKQAITFGAKWPKPDLKQLWDKFSPYRAQFQLFFAQYEVPNRYHPYKDRSLSEDLAQTHAF